MSPVCNKLSCTEAWRNVTQLQTLSELEAANNIMELWSLYVPIEAYPPLYPAAVMGRCWLMYRIHEPFCDNQPNLCFLQSLHY
jgi:hypothetical protein